MGYDVSKFINYPSYYQHCIDLYDSNTDSTVYDVKACPNYFNNFIWEEEDLLPIIADKAKYKLDNDIGTEHQKSCKGHKALTDFWDIHEVSEFAQIICPLLENNVFGSRIIVEEVSIYEALICSQTQVDRLRKTGIYVWHSDVVPKQIVRLLIYLSDVDMKNGPFSHLIDLDTGQPIETNSPNQYLCAENLLGPFGTHILFSPNILHRANLAVDNPPRLCMALTFRPWHKEAEYVHPDHTTSWSMQGKKTKLMGYGFNVEEAIK